MRKRYQINLPLFLLIQVGWWISLFLTCREIITNRFCPPIFSIPACYFMFLFFSLMLIALFLKNNLQKILFYIPAFLGLLLALWNSYLQSIESHPAIMHCPQMFDLPLCYLALITFAVILIIKIKEDLKSKKKKVIKTKSNSKKNKNRKK